MTLDQAMAELKALGNEGMRAYNAKNGAGENQFGVKMGDIRAIAKKIKTDHALALSLWQTGNLEARLLATLICKPAQFSADELDRMVRDVPHPPHMAPSQLGDWLTSYVVKAHPQKEALRQKWMADSDPMASRAGWSLTCERIVMQAPRPDEPRGEGAGGEGSLDIPALLDRIEREMAGAPPPAQWTMNFCLGEIGINFREHRERALAIGEKLGLYRDYPTSKGCIPPYVPVWIAEMARRRA